MDSELLYMQQCLTLAEKGLGKVAPNPLVGAILVYEDRIIGEGFHEAYGQNHAEVNCIKAALKHASPDEISNSTLYVNLEPCAHYGKTPPCADFIIKHQIKKVVIANSDPFVQVNGKGLEMLRAADIEVKEHVLEKEGRVLNRRFFTFHEERRPYIILKWAQTLNGYIAPLENGYAKKQRISNEYSHKLVHKWRSEEQGIMVGTNTALIDNPRLDVREWTGKNPLRILLDKDLRLPPESHLLDREIPSLVFTSKASAEYKNLRYVSIDFENAILPQIFEVLYRMQIQSLMVEGGRMLLQSLIAENYWDEARIFTSSKIFPIGISAPVLDQEAILRSDIEDDSLAIYRNDKN